MIILKNIKSYLLTFLILLIYNCTPSTGIDERPLKTKLNKNTSKNNYSISDIKVNIINLNKSSDLEIELYNKPNIEEINYSINKFSEIYNYNYEYILGPADTISINLTDTDDLDGTYLIDQEGMIDLPFIGKVKLDNLNINDAQKILINIIKDFYINPDLQINIEDFNSSKVYVLGAVRKQVAISLDQKPINLIEAAIIADFNPSSSEKSFGTKGLLRRDNQVYKINLSNAFKSKDDKENFFLKKNDVIFIDRNSDAIHVFGEVSKTGVYYPNLDYSLTELISTSGLNQLTADAKSVYVIREKYKTFLEVDVFQLDIRNPVSLLAGRKFRLQPKDILFIPPSPIVKWNRTISLLLPQTDLFNSYNPIIQDGVKGGADANITD